MFCETVLKYISGLVETLTELHVHIRKGLRCSISTTERRETKKKERTGEGCYTRMDEGVGLVRKGSGREKVRECLLEGELGKVKTSRVKIVVIRGWRNY